MSINSSHFLEYKLSEFNASPYNIIKVHIYPINKEITPIFCMLNKVILLYKLGPLNK